MSIEDSNRISDYFQSILEHPRSFNEIKTTFEAAGFIDKNGNVLEPYDKVFTVDK